MILAARESSAPLIPLINELTATKCKNGLKQVSHLRLSNFICTMKLGYNELGYHELGYHELGCNELGCNELGYNEIGYNE